jgi:hypothetical protein
MASLGLLICYAIRLQKPSRRLVDWLKWVGVAFLILYSAIGWDFSDGSIVATYLITNLTIPILAAIYLYDRWILKPESMKRKFVIILSVQTLLIIGLFAFSIVQKAEADWQREFAIEQSQLAEKARELAEQQRMQAEMALRQAAHVTSKLRISLDSAMAQ